MDPTKEKKWTPYGAYGLVALGLMQPLGYYCGWTALRGISAATAASPLPIVFSDVKGLETFASRFVLHLETKGHPPQQMEITPSLYAKFRGPYNRRNVYGAAISYGPRLPRSIWSSVLHYGFCNGPLALDLGLGSEVTLVGVEIQTKTAGRQDRWRLQTPCNP